MENNMKNKWLNITQKDNGMFERVFGVPLKLYFDGIYGFDMVKFEKLFNVPDSMALSDYIETMHGKKSVELIERLI